MYNIKMPKTKKEKLSIHIGQKQALDFRLHAAGKISRHEQRSGIILTSKDKQKNRSYRRQIERCAMNTY